MADKVTTTKSTAPTPTDNTKKINDLLDQARDLLVEDGMDPASAEAFTNFARPGSPSITGNLADLQRMGAIAITGEMPTPPGEDDLVTTDIKDAFVEPVVPPEPPAAKDMAEISAAAEKAEKK